MNEDQLEEIVSRISTEIIHTASSHLDFKVALVGLIGVITGILGQGVIEWLRGCPKRKLDKQRESLLQCLLKDTKKHEWRDLETLSKVIGADQAETTRLLIKIGARGSTGEKNVWALIEKKPLDSLETDS